MEGEAKVREEASPQEDRSPTRWIHDLNNLIAGIRVHVTLAKLRLRDDDEELEGVLNEIENNCEAVSVLLSQRPQAFRNSQTLHSTAEAAADIHPVAARDQAEMPRTQSGLVVMMDDNESLQISLAKILREVGYDVELALRGEDCIDLVRKLHARGQKVDVVILDVKVPHGLGGIETLQALRGIDPSIKAIATSGYSETDVMANFPHYGFKAALSKPFRVQELINLLDQLLSKK